MSDARLKNLDDFADQSDDFERRFDSLLDEDGTSSERLQQLVGEITAWLQVCVEHGRYLSSASPERRAFRSLIEQWNSRLRQHGRRPEGIDHLADFDPRAGFVLPYEKFPYHGLSAFTEADSHKFFGREDQVSGYTEHLDQYFTLVIQSESGGGKSSVAMAGVLPLLKNKRHPEWVYTERITPGTKPMEVLRDALTKKLGPSLVISPFDARGVLTALNNRTLVIFVDQLEELLTLCTDETEQATFCHLLAAIVASRNVRILATLRSDHYDRLANSQLCRPLFLALSENGGVKTLPPMSFDQIRRAILRPAEAIGLRFIPTALIEQLANETANAAGGLPLLQFALQRLWELRPRNDQGEPLDLIGEEAFKKLPSVREALGAVAETHFRELSDALQRACERLMLELTVLDDRLEVPLRRRRRENELIDVLVVAKFASAAEALQLIEGFVQRGLLVRTGEGETRQIEVAHEALFRHWDRFQAWINSEATRVRLQQVRQIARDAVEWEQESRSSDYLRLKGNPLGKALEYRAENWLDRVSQRYVEACKLQEQKQRWIRRGVGACLAFMLVGFLYMGWRLIDIAFRREAAFSVLTPYILQLDPLEALDLAFTLENRSPGRFVAPLAHAIDRLMYSEVVGVRENGADFTASGEAISQITRGEKGRLEVSILPIEANGSKWTEPVVIKIVEDINSNGSLASLNVGPPIAGTPERRLVVMSFVDLNDPVNKFKRLVAYWIDKRPPDAHLIIDHPYSPGTVEVSEIAFDSTGERAAIAALQFFPQPKGELLLLEKSEQGKLVVKPLKDPHSGTQLGPRNQGVVRAVAFADTGTGREDKQGKPPLITGRLDGSVFCGEKPVRSPDQSPVISLRATGTGPSYVALHASNKLVVGNCEIRKAELLDQTLTSPQSLSLRMLSDKAWLQLSFTDSRKLCVWWWETGTFSGRDMLKDCWVADVKVDQAIPVLDKNRNPLDAYLTLPNRKNAWLVRLHLGSHIENDSIPQNGIPVAWLPDYSSTGKKGPSSERGYPAASPNGAYVVEVEPGKGIIRRDGGPPLPKLENSEKQIAVSVNDTGVITVLDSDRKLTVVQIGKDPSVVNLGFQGSCFKMSPDGNKVLVAGAKGEATVIEVGTAKSLREIKANVEDEISRGATLSACALGNDGTLVFVFQDGRVAYADPKVDKLRLVSELVGFRMPGALDASIDETSRFVTVLSERVRGICPAGVTGYPVRIWDIKQERFDFPVASACLPHDKLLRIGPIKKTSQEWILPIYQEDGATLKRFGYPCLGCEPTDQSNGVMAIAEKKFQAKRLTTAEIRRFYGFQP
jgi:hypothetical protein